MKLDENKVVKYTRISLFVVYFWFGILKTIGISPAETLVQNLSEFTINYFLDDSTFIPLFGIFECLIGILFLFPKYTKIAVGVFLLHMLSTFLPMVVLPKDAWAFMFTPTLVGQYIIKNLTIIGAALLIYTHHQRTYNK
ncbi:MAG: hypothetical protein HWD84_06905 [Flavobacteriaceae bacterium]|jgi:uncharacterized membrane protein YkgB|nr:hypothetical protein [Flavobacteriaceae bacterium]